MKEYLLTSFFSSTRPLRSAAVVSIYSPIPRRFGAPGRSTPCNPSARSSLPRRPPGGRRRDREARHPLLPAHHVRGVVREPPCGCPLAGKREHAPGGVKDNGAGGDPGQPARRSSPPGVGGVQRAAYPGCGKMRKVTASRVLRKAMEERVYALLLAFWCG